MLANYMISITDFHCPATVFTDSVRTINADRDIIYIDDMQLLNQVKVGFISQQANLFVNVIFERFLLFLDVDSWSFLTVRLVGRMEDDLGAGLFIARVVHLPLRRD